MKQLITLIFVILTLNASAQVIDTDKKIENKIVKKYKGKKFFDNLYKDIFKYATVYVAGDIGNAYETQYPDYFIRTNPDDLYAIPRVEDQTIYHPFDYRLGFGVRKLARFDYEVKGKNYYDGTENNKALSAPTAAVQGFEYLFHWEKERQRSDEFTNSRYFLRHTGDYHIVKVEQREVGNIDFKYQSAEVRARLPIGKKFSISAGVIARTHQKAFGYNPIELWLNEVDEDGNAVLDENGDQLVTLGLKSVWKAIIKDQANGLLQPTDWMVVKASEVADYSVPSQISTDRAAIRTASNTIEASITNASDHAAFMALFDTPVDSDGNPTGNPPIADWPD